MIDFHSHILPGMDDGARSVAESVRMLRQSSEQHIGTVVATPHFYRQQESVDSFLERRAAALHQLLDAVSDERCPRILSGAEVRVFRGLSRLDLRPLCTEGTDLLLLELPMMFIPSWVLEEVEDIIYTQGLRILLAHIERYFGMLSKEQLGELLRFPDITVQISGEAMLSSFSRCEIRQHIPYPKAVVFGSDMHRPTGRAQNLGQVEIRLRHSFTGRRWLSLVKDTEQELMNRQIDK